MKKWLKTLTSWFFIFFLCANTFSCKKDKKGENWIWVLLFGQPPATTVQPQKTLTIYENGQLIEKGQVEEKKEESKSTRGATPYKEIKNGKATVDIREEKVQNFLVKNALGILLAELRLKFDKAGQLKIASRSNNKIGVEVDKIEAKHPFVFPLKEGDYKKTDFGGNENCFVNDYYGNGTYHDGCDYFRIDAKAYPEVFSAAYGTVTKLHSSCKEGEQTGCNDGLGNEVEITATNEGRTYKFRYWHLSKVNSKLKKGMSISNQDLIGLMGSTGSRGGTKKYGVHLHFKIQIGAFEAYGYSSDKGKIEENYLDPATFGFIERGTEFISFYEIEVAPSKVKGGDSVNIKYKYTGDITCVIASLKRDSYKGEFPNENYVRLENEVENTGTISMAFPINASGGLDWRPFVKDCVTGTYNSGLETTIVEATSGPTCTAGQTETQSCASIANGTSTKSRTCKSDGTWGDFDACQITCNSGYYQSNGQCIKNPDCTAGQTETQSCASIANGTSTKSRTCKSDGTWGDFDACQITCNSGYYQSNGQCIKNPDCTAGQTETQSCASIANGTSTKSRTCKSDGTWGDFDACQITCNSGYYQSNGQCIKNPDCTAGQTETQSCASIANGTSTKSRTCKSDGTWGDFGTCLITCNSGYYQSNGQCLPNPVCTAGQTETQSCASIANGTSTKSRTCKSDGTWGDFDACQITCNSGYYQNNGQCLPNPVCTAGQTETQSCGSIANGTSTKSRTCGSNGQWGAFSSCVITCNSGYTLENGQCVLNGVCTPGAKETQWCSIPNGTGYQARTCMSNKQWSSWDSTCTIYSCNANYHQESNSCVYNYSSCNITNGTGEMSWLGSNWSNCYVKSCNSGYTQSGNSCVALPALQILSGSVTYGSMLTWPYDTNTFKATSSINTYSELEILMSKSNGAGFATSGTYYVDDNATGDGITSGSYSAGSAFKIKIPKTWLKIGKNRIKIRLYADPPNNSIHKSDSEIEVQRNN